MDYIRAILLGLVQGVAEFLPISSSGHLAILHRLMPQTEAAMSDVTFDILLHLGTLVAVCIVFHKTIFNLLREFYRMCAGILGGTFLWRKANKYQIMSLYVIVTTAVLIPFALAHSSILALGENMFVLGGALLFTAFMLFVADHSVEENKQMKDMTLMQAVKMGLFQGMATLPGISRSGMTIAAGINMGFDRNTMVEFSFMMSIPAVLGAVVMDFSEMVGGFAAANIGPYIVGTLVAMIAGIASIKLLKYVAKKNKFGWFMWYCAAIGIVAIVLGIIG
ncbi:MAG: undecaprenyl-diphosphate phosphatase [Clostridia bacterium]|nr:undecaprenyl-diphosphate phosphatase [Clostridia bacterium]